MNYEELSKLVVQWGKDKGIFSKSTPLRQLDKTQEELEETREALIKLIAPNAQEIKAIEEVKDGIGDMLVTIIMLGEMVGMDTVNCLQTAYDVIKQRTGRMVDGQFVKDES
jgi:NTP pyrophosphatase (non-canonical NTP hydrolase)